MLLSLYSGCGGFDLGFQQAGFNIGLAYDNNRPAIESWNLNASTASSRARLADITQLTLSDLDANFNGYFRPTGVVGGPPCQSFSRANSHKRHRDRRTDHVTCFVDLAMAIHVHRTPLSFIVMENVPELCKHNHGEFLQFQKDKLSSQFYIYDFVLNARDVGTPQNRIRYFMIASATPIPSMDKLHLRHTYQVNTVRQAIAALPEPVYFDQAREGIFPMTHTNHWCMTPRSPRFHDGSLANAQGRYKSFKVLQWDQPSPTVSYGHREVHVHPHGHRRLSVYEAMLLQGFPSRYVLRGPMSSQFEQVSQAVPPALSHAVAQLVLTATSTASQPRSYSRFTMSSSG